MSKRPAFPALGLAVAIAASACTHVTVPGPTGSHPPRSSLPAGTAAGQYAVGRIELAAGRHEAALQRFRAALRIDARYVEAMNGIGVALGELGRHDAAIEAFEQAAVIAPSAHVLSNLGLVQLRAGRLEDAWHSLARAFELEPSNERTRANLRLALKARTPEAGPVSEGAEASVPATPGGDAAAPPRAMRWEPVLRYGPSDLPTSGEVAPTAGRVVPTIPDAAPRPPFRQADPPGRDHRGAYTAVTAPAEGAGLVLVAPNVYELRAGARGGAGAPPSSSASYGASPRTAMTAALRDAATSSITAGHAGAARVEVGNGVGIHRLAARTAAELVHLGFQPTRLTDVRPFGRAASRIEFRPGYASQARALGDAMGVPVPIVPSALLRETVDLRLVIGIDLADREQGARGAGTTIVSSRRRGGAGEPGAGWRMI
jgi:hypothetical protein